MQESTKVENVTTVTTSTASRNGHVCPDSIPPELTALPQWVLWKYVPDDKGLPQKVPFSVDGGYASSTNPETWAPFEYVADCYERGGYEGIGFVFATGGDRTGIDLDGCRNPETGAIEQWGHDIVERFNTYTEVSPSGTGVKMFVRGKWPLPTGKNLKFNDKPRVGDKDPGVEAYDHGRFFCVTGQHVDGTPRTPQPRQDAINWFAARYWPPEPKTPQRATGATYVDDNTVVERARKYLAKIPPAVSGSGGHNATFHAACVLVLGFGLSQETAIALLAEWNETCLPPWSTKELEHKIDSADKQTGERNYLRDVAPERWDSVPVPAYKEPEREPPAFAKLLSCPELIAMDLRQQFLVKRILVAGQPGVIGGRSKTLKTSLATDLVVSLGSGTKFLGEFPAERVTVGFWSGESGAAVIRETAQRVAKSKGVSLADCSIFWNFSLPKLSMRDHLEVLATVILDKKLQVAVIDPLYLALLTADAAGKSSDLFFMGAMLQPLAELTRETGATIVLLHHFRKTGQVDEEEPAGLEELAQSGVAEWARQWILLQRRAPYQGDGCHELFMRAGGSAGHASLWGVDVDEGVLDPETFEGRKWNVEVKSISDARAAAKQSRERRKVQEQEQKASEYRRRLLEALRQFPDGETSRVLREASGLNSTNYGVALRALLQEGRATACQVAKSGGEYDGFRGIER